LPRRYYYFHAYCYALRHIDTLIISLDAAPHYADAIGYAD